MFTSPKLRVHLFKIHYRLIKHHDIEEITKYSNVGDWYLLYMIGVNIDAGIFSEVFHEMAERIKEDSDEKHPIV